ncbi:MAG: lipid A biosynthesis acyltransferase [Candidatus Binatia bacterium]|nr:MAG: lipid A biosynthesis acyltransferase [Candidatus Binatia bacterium]
MALGAARVVPLRWTPALATALGAFLYRVLPSVRKLSERHLELALGHLPAAERSRIARAALAHAALSFCEIAKFDELVPELDELVEVEGEEIVEDVLRLGRGAIVVTGHIGNWELLGAYFARRGIPVVAVARRIYEERIDRLVVAFRARHGVRTVHRSDRSAAREILRTLRARGILAMVVDQDTHAPSLTVPFFGLPARSPVAPAVLALRTGAPLVPVFIERIAGGRHRIFVHPPLPTPEGGDRIVRVRALLEDINRALERQIRRRPEQWVWWHRRWRRGPVPRLDLDAKFPYGRSG